MVGSPAGSATTCWSQTFSNMVRGRRLAVSCSWVHGGCLWVVLRCGDGVGLRREALWAPVVRGARGEVCRQVGRGWRE